MNLYLKSVLGFETGSKIWSSYHESVFLANSKTNKKPPKNPTHKPKKAQQKTTKNPNLKIPKIKSDRFYTRPVTPPLY